MSWKDNRDDTVTERILLVIFAVLTMALLGAVALLCPC